MASRGLSALCILSIAQRLAFARRWAGLREQSHVCELHPQDSLKPRQFGRHVSLHVVVNTQMFDLIRDVAAVFSGFHHYEGSSSFLGTGSCLLDSG